MERKGKGECKVIVSNHIHIAAGTRRDDNVNITSKRRHDVVLML